MERTNLDKLLFKHGINKLMSLVKYPSILTYHELGERGTLNDYINGEDFNGKTVYGTEKIDGSNSFICFTTDYKGNTEDYFIGSRTEPLYFMNDRTIVNHSNGIADNIKGVADNIVALNDGFGWTKPLKPHHLYVLFGETYGGKINGWKEYSMSGEYGFRVFDLIEMSIEKADERLEDEIEKISSWRENGGQPFVGIETLDNFCKDFLMKRVPALFVTAGESIPNDLSGVYNWLQNFSESLSKLNNNGRGKAEGVVVRTYDRKTIRKIRFEDYERSKRAGKF